MPKIVAPNHPDCYIDCPSGHGTAYYREPHGPCYVSCNETGMAEAISNHITQTVFDQSFSISMDMDALSAGFLLDAIISTDRRDHIILFALAIRLRLSTSPNADKFRMRRRYQNITVPRLLSHIWLAVDRLG